MDYALLGNTGVKISGLGFGTMSFGGDADESTSQQMFRRCRDAGINFFDCADVYAGGRSEELLGGFIADCRDEVVITSKAYFPTGKSVNDRGSSRYHLVRAVEASLRRLGTDRIDVYFLHRFDDVTDLEETMRGLELLVQQGKILYPAVSNFSAWQTVQALGIAKQHSWAPLVATQPMYNLVKRQAEAEILPMARALDVGVISYSPLAGGLLTGKYSRDGRRDTDGAVGRLVDNKMYATRYGDPANFEIAAGFTELARDAGLHPASLAVAWVAAHPAITCPLIGARNIEQLEPVLAAAEITMTPELYDAISALSPTPPPATDRNEEKTAHNYGSR